MNADIMKRNIHQIDFRNPVSIKGEFLIKVEVEGNVTTKKHTLSSTLKQSGTKVYGETSTTNENEVLIIDGEVSSSGNFQGFYSAKGIQEHGTGNFSFSINSGNQMNGVWSGYDVANKKIANGKCLLVPVFKSFEIASHSESNVQGVIALSDDELGKDYFSQDSLSDLMKKEGMVLSVALNSSGKVIGFILGFVARQSEIQTFLKKIKPVELRAGINAEKIGVLKTMAISNDYKGQGIGTALIKDCISKLEMKGVSLICALAWQCEKGINVGHILENEHFEIRHELKKYWAEDSIQRNYNCPECGEPPCNCSAVIYSKMQEKLK
jgi:predicted N-acetyltransferase YhbS